MCIKWSWVEAQTVWWEIYIFWKGFSCLADVGKVGVSIKTKYDKVQWNQLSKFIMTWNIWVRHPLKFPLDWRGKHCDVWKDQVCVKRWTGLSINLRPPKNLVFPPDGWGFAGFLPQSAPRTSWSSPHVVFLRFVTCFTVMYMENNSFPCTSVYRRLVMLFKAGQIVGK